MYIKNILFVPLIFSSIAFADYTENQNKKFLDESVKMMNYAFPMEMNGLRFGKVENIENKGILMPLTIMEDISEVESAFMEEFMKKMMSGMALEACNDPTMKDLFKRDLMIIYNFKDLDGSMDFKLTVDNTYCSN